MPSRCREDFGEAGRFPGIARELPPRVHGFGDLARVAGSAATGHKSAYVG